MADVSAASLLDKRERRKHFTKIGELDVVAAEHRVQRRLPIRLPQRFSI